MGKAKRGKKLDYENDADDHIETEKTADDDVSSKTKKKEKKVKDSSVLDSDSDEDTGKKKSSKKAKDVDSAADGLKELSISNKSKKDKKKAKGGVSDDESEPVAPKSKKKGKKTGDDDSDEETGGGGGGGGGGGRGGFAALAMSDDDEDEPQGAPSIPSDDEPEVPKEAPSKPESKKAGGKKSKKKKKDEDDEDLGKILAELELEYSGQAPPPEATPTELVPTTEVPEPETKKSKKKKKEEKQEEKLEEKKPEEGEKGDGEADGDDEDGKTMKSAAQKRKEKKEREKMKRQAESKVVKTKEGSVEAEENEEKKEKETQEPDDKPDDPDDNDDDDKKKKKKKKGTKEEKEKEKKGMPNKKVVAAMQEALKKIKEEEERIKKEEEERLKQEEEAEKIRQEQLRLEQERKEKRKAKEKERKERLKAEGKLLTAKQKADKARAEAMIEAMKAMYGAAAVLPGSKPAAPKSQSKKKRSEPADAKIEAGDKEEKVDEEKSGKKISESESTPPPSEEPVNDVKDSWEDTEDVKDAWDAESGDEKIEDKKSAAVTREKKVEVEVKDRNGPVEGDKGEDSDEESDDSSDESDDSESDESSDEHQEKKTDAEKKRERALARIKSRQENAEKSMTLDELRAAVVCVLGHVDTGKTKILDKLRRTNVQDGEAGGITQQIGATNVPIDAIKEQTRHVKGFSQLELKIPGLLIIDTPGHESFSNLRSRGSSLCDIAILVVDIMHGLEPQTIESLNLLKQKKTPFLVALNKIDRLYDWQTMNRKDIRDIIKGQASNTQLEFEQRAKEVILQFAEQGMNAALFYENQDPRSYVSLVPTSAITGEGMGNLLALIIESCQTHLAKRLMFSEELQATVLEVKAISGLGTTIDVILVNGYLKEGDTVVLAGTEAPIVTQIRSLLMPQPLKELRVKNAYVEFKEIKAAQGVKIAAKDLEKVIAGLNLRVAYKPDEVEILREEAGRELKSALSSIKLQERGVYVQASTLGSLEALLEFLKTSSIPYANIRIGPVVKKDVMKASTMLEHDSQYATILAFDVKIERDAQELADSLGVRIFQADIIYHLFDKFMAYREELKRKKREEFKSIAVFPCKLRILPQFVFNSRDPIVMGVIVEAGIVKEGTPICVPSKEFVDIGIVTSIEVNHKNQETARKGQEVCIKIEPIPGEAPKMFGRHFDEKDLLISKISRQSIDACKDYFREDLVKTDWQLMVELKKLFQIL